MPNAKRTKRKKDLIGQRQNPEHTLNDAKLKIALTDTKWRKTYLTEFLERAEKNTPISYVNLKGYFEMFE